MSDNSLTHDSAFAELGAFALGALDATTAEAVERHLSSCRICEAELSALREALAKLPSAPTGTMDRGRSQAIRSRLVLRAEGKTSPARAPQPWRMLALAASVAFTIVGFGYAGERTKVNEAERLYTERLAEARQLRARVADQDARIAAITGPSVSVMEMSAKGVNAPTARMFWDRATNRWTVFAHGLAQPKAGRAYELWLVTADKKIPAGVFKPTPDGSAVFAATYALRPEDLKAIAVTEEPEAGVTAPTGSIILLGSAAAS